MNRRNFLKGFIITATVVTLAPLAPIVELPVSTATFESLVATTLQNYRKALADNITKGNAVWFYLKRRKMITELTESYPIVEPIYY
jgi:hypothetical protein